MSSRLGLVDISATGQPTSSSIRRTYLIACAGNWPHERAPAVVRDLGFGPAVFVPLSGQERRLGVLVVARDRFAPDFSEGQVALVSLFAAQAAVALAFGQARAELERMGRVEERERIARNLHDTVIQRLFATGMALEGTVPLIERSEVRARL